MPRAFIYPKYLEVPIKQIVQTQIKKIFNEQFGQSLHCVLFSQHSLDTLQGREMDELKEDKYRKEIFTLNIDSLNSLAY